MTDTVESVRQVYASRCAKAQAAIDIASSDARTDRDAAIARAHFEYQRRIDAALLAYDEEVKSAITDRVTAMKALMLADRVRPS